jgi:hypothetical protein
MELIIPFKTIGMMVLLLIVPYLCFTTKDYPSCRNLPLFRKMKIKMEVFIMIQIKLKVIIYICVLFILHYAGMPNVFVKKIQLLYIVP